MLEIQSVQPGSPARKAGFQNHDILHSINGKPVNDLLDLMFLAAEPELIIEASRNDVPVHKVIRNPRHRPLGIDPVPFRIKRCNNRCVFCFVDQMKKGCRPTLYIKDEDYRLSFLDSAYICGSNLTDKDLNRIIDQRLSPIYISVHSTNEEIRSRLLRNLKLRPILPLLRLLSEQNIRFNTQIVLTPGINDGPDLEKTILDLAGLGKAVISMALVPLGLTRHRDGLTPLTPVTPAYARKMVLRMQALQTVLKKQGQNRLFFLSDEWYIKAGLPLPPYSHYADFPQFDNGVGMMRDFITGFNRFLASAKKGTGKQIAVATGFSAAAHLTRLFRKLTACTGNSYTVIPVENRSLGELVTVSGLLFGNDILHAVQNTKKTFQALFLPPNCLNTDRVTLDGLSEKALTKALKIPVKAIADLNELII